MTGILLSLIAFFGWGTSDYVASRLSKYHPSAVNLYYQLVTIVFAVGVSVFFGMPEVSVSIFWPHLIAAGLVNAAFIVFVKAFSYGVVGPVSSISNAYAIVTALASAVFLGEAIGISGWFAILIVAGGISLISHDKQEKHTSASHRVSAPIGYAILSLVLFGAGFFMFDVASTQEWYQDYALFQIASAVVSLSIFALWKAPHRSADMKVLVSSKTAFAGGVIATIGTMGFFAAIKVTGSATIPAVVSAASPLVTSLWARYIDHERLGVAKRIGALIVVAGVILLSI